MYCFVVVFVTVAVVVATAPYFDLKGRMQCHDIWKNTKCVNLYYVKLVYWLLWKSSCFVKRYFLHIHVQCKVQWNFHHWIKTWIKKNYEYFDIWKLSEANIMMTAWIIIASWPIILLKKYFVLFFFSICNKWSQEFVFRRVHNASIKVFYSCQFMWFF